MLVENPYVRTWLQGPFRCLSKAFTIEKDRVVEIGERKTQEDSLDSEKEGKKAMAAFFLAFIGERKPFVTGAKVLIWQKLQKSAVEDIWHTGTCQAGARVTPSLVCFLPRY